MIDPAITRLSQLVDIWYNAHGKTLKDHKYRYDRLIATCYRMNNPLVSDFDASVFSEYRAFRITQVKAVTVNHEMRYLRAVFNELDRLGFYDGGNPLSKIRQFRETERQLGFLTTDQIPFLLSACSESRNRHLTTVVKICLSTGARFGEAEYLLRSGLLNTDQPALRFTDTKNGKSRSVPISSQLHLEILSVARSAQNIRLFNDCRSAFRSAVKRSRIQLPEGQATHILRHTFASHFMMNGGNILTLKELLGHSDIKITMRYAHLSPEYMNQALDLNPLVGISQSSSNVVGIFESLKL
ncbi:MAG: tyrosine-type recombinase/integrase [Saccharospirillaceae bacterium]|nr:tyrosine-type recombinase/integrase [Saccharospirillaceae bacterium]